MVCSEVELYQSCRHDVIHDREPLHAERGKLEGTRHSFMRCHLTGMSRQEVDAVGMVAEAYRRDARDGLQPSAGCGVTPHLVVEVIAVAVHVVAQPGGACILDGCTAGHHEAQLRMHRHGILYRLADAVVHHFLPIAVIGKAAMRTVVGVSPCLMVAVNGIGVSLQPLCILYEISQVRLEGCGESRLLAHLLNRDVLPGLVGNDVGKGSTWSVSASSVLDLAVLEGVVRLRHVYPVRLEALAAAVGIADNHLHACLLCQFPKVLLHGILREAVADSQHTDDAVPG